MDGRRKERYSFPLRMRNTFRKSNTTTTEDPSFPLDAHIVTYIIKGETYTDLCRGSKVKIFDLYFDKFGHGAVQKIAWGYGKISPKIWGYKAPEKKKRK